MSKTTTNKQENLQIDLEELLSVEANDNDSPAALKAKLLLDKHIGEFPSAFDYIHVPVGTIPSLYETLLCYRKLAFIVSNDTSKLHSDRLLSNTLMRGPSTVYPDKVINHTVVNGAKVDVEYPVNCGLLLTQDSGMDHFCASITSNLIVSCVATDKLGNSRVIDLDSANTKLGMLDLMNQKKKWGGSDKNAIVSRDKIFAHLIHATNAVSGIVTHSMCGGALPNYRKDDRCTNMANDELIKEYKKKNKPLPPPLVVKVCDVQNARPLFVRDLKTVWHQFAARISITGDNNPSKVYCGYNRFGMAASEARTLATVQDFISVCKKLNVKIIVLADRRDISQLVLRTLVLNGYTILCKAGVENEWVPDCSPGVYNYSNSHKQDIGSENMVFFLHYNIVDYYPKITVKEPEHRTDHFKRLIKYLTTSTKTVPKVFLYAVLNDMLTDLLDFSLHPCVSAEQMRCLLVKGAKTTHTVGKLLIRASVANYEILNFPRSRRPFLWIDPCREELCYATPITLPASRVNLEKKSAYSLEDDDAFVGDNFYRNSEVPSSELPMPNVTQLAPIRPFPEIFRDFSNNDFRGQCVRYRRHLDGERQEFHPVFQSLIDRCEGINVNLIDFLFGVSDNTHNYLAIYREVVTGLDRETVDQPTPDAPLDEQDNVFSRGFNAREPEGGPLNPFAGLKIEKNHKYTFDEK